MAVTVGVLLLAVVIGLVPQIPLPVKLVIQLAIAAVIYFVFSEATFPLPVSEDALLTELFGGNGGMGGFNKVSMGVLYAAVGILFSLIGIPIQMKMKAE